MFDRKNHVLAFWFGSGEEGGSPSAGKASWWTTSSNHVLIDGNEFWLRSDGNSSSGNKTCEAAEIIDVVSRFHLGEQQLHCSKMWNFYLSKTQNSRAATWDCSPLCGGKSHRPQSSTRCPQSHHLLLSDEAFLFFGVCLSAVNCFLWINATANNFSLPVFFSHSAVCK